MSKHVVHYVSFCLKKRQSTDNKRLLSYKYYAWKILSNDDEDPQIVFYLTKFIKAILSKQQLLSDGVIMMLKTLKEQFIAIFKQKEHCLNTKHSSPLRNKVFVSFEYDIETMFYKMEYQVYFLLELNVHTILYHRLNIRSNTLYNTVTH